MRTCDVLISGGVVIDGTGGPRRRGDVAIIGDRIAAIDTAGGWAAAATVDAAGKIVAPGFIDTHTHDDRALLSSPEMTPRVSQGVTTVVAGNCGVSLAPLAHAADPPPPMNLLGGRNWYRFATMARYRAQLAATPPALNVVPLLGHTTLRVGAMETVDGPAAVGEMAAMERALARALDEGAAGLSTGLAYPPAVRSSADEVTALALHVGSAGGIYATHVRDEGPEAVAAIEEGLAVGRETGVPVVFSHHKAWGRDRWGTVGRTLEVIERASASQPVALDVYPYTAGSSVLLKAWLPVSERVLITWSDTVPEAAGRDLDELAAEWDCDAADAVDRLQPAGAVYFSMSEDDVREVLSHPLAMIGSDGLPHDANPHPRLWGTFPRVLGHYVREVGLFDLETAVHKMTSLPAKVFGLEDRGVLSPGAFADVVVVDEQSVSDRATYQEPTQAAAGIESVVVNGAVVWDGAGTRARPGRWLTPQH